MCQHTSVFHELKFQYLSNVTVPTHLRVPRDLDRRGVEHGGAVVAHIVYERSLPDHLVGGVLAIVHDLDLVLQRQWAFG